MWTAIDSAMRSIAFLATALLAAAFATPLDGGLIGLPSPDSIVPAPAFSADTFLTPAEQFLNSGQPPNSGNRIFPATDSDAVTEAKLDISDDPDKQGVQVASAAASPSDENVKSLDASNTDQPTFSTSLNLPANLLKTDFTVSASLPEDASNPETACIDSSTESAPKVRRDDLSDFLDSVKNHFSLDGLTAPNSCSWHPTQQESAPSADAVPSLLPKPKLPGPARPQLRPQPGKTPSRRPDDPYDEAGMWNYPVIKGGRRLGGDQSCKGIFGRSYWKIFTLVCGGPTGRWYGDTASTVQNCQSVPGDGVFRSRDDYEICYFCCKDFIILEALGVTCKPLFTLCTL